MQKLISILLAAIFAGVTLTAVAADAPKKEEKKMEKKAVKKPAKKAAKKEEMKK